MIRSLLEVENVSRSRVSNPRLEGQTFLRGNGRKLFLSKTKPNKVQEADHEDDHLHDNSFDQDEVSEVFLISSTVSFGTTIKMVLFREGSVVGRHGMSS
jgi:hypothetical protein